MNPHQSVLLQTDVYRLLAELLGDEPGVIIDGGANVGESVAAIRRWFPRATVHAFEPVTRCFEALAQRVPSFGGSVFAHQLALGEAAIESEIRVNRNLWTCSLLPASDRGLAYHGDWCETVDWEPIRVVRLDEWLRASNLPAPRMIKLDLQGFEAAALRGAERVLDEVEAVYAEAQLIPEYVGASLFSDIDALLRAHGFGLYQLADLCLKGRHAEPSCCDGIWLRNDVLERVRAGDAPRVVRERGLDRSARMAEALEICSREGLRRVGIYGAGAHTISCAPALAAATLDIVAIIDDAAPRRGMLWGYPVVACAAARKLGLDAVVISSDRAETAIFAAAEPLRNDGIVLVTLYGDSGIEMHRRWASIGAGSDDT